VRPTLVLATAAVVALAVLGDVPAEARPGPAAKPSPGPVALGQVGSGLCGITAPAAVVIGTQAAGHSSYIAPYNGVLTSFSHQANGTAGQVRALVLADGPTNLQLVVAGKSEKQTVRPSSLNVFATRVPIRAGQRLALWYSATSMACVTSGYSGDATLAQASFNPDTSGTFVASGVVADSSGTTLRPNIAATLEPDRDGDGYGDITQDGCPASGQIVAPCPDTKITKRPHPRPTRSKAKVKVKFTASIAGSSFQCRLDGHKKWKACGSPYKKRLGIGRHKLQVRAVSPAGVPDPKPAKVRFRIRRG
jgi:hypothetical protein